MIILNKDQLKYANSIPSQKQTEEILGKFEGLFFVFSFF